MSDTRYLLDENVDPLYRTELLARNPDLIVWRVGMLGTPPSGTLDPDILFWCEENSFILVTNNRKSMPRHLKDHLEQSRHTPGIVVMTETMSIGETLDELLLIASASLGGEYQDRIVYLPIT